MCVCACVFEQAKSKCGQVTLLRAASMAEQATACGQLAKCYFSVFSGLEAWTVIEGYFQQRTMLIVTYNQTETLSYNITLDLPSLTHRATAANATLLHGLCWLS